MSHADTLRTIAAELDIVAPPQAKALRAMAVKVGAMEFTLDEIVADAQSDELARFTEFQAMSEVVRPIMSRALRLSTVEKL